MPFSKANNIVGWVVFGLATLVYGLTLEETASYWDCGEFIAVSYKLMVPHPPGAPFFLLLGRMFSFLAFGDETQVAFWINMLSVLASGFTILFLFWSITLLGRKLLKTTADKLNNSQLLALMASGVVGALAYTFSDSFWFSAVEAEVYAMSSFFTAFVFWAILKWELIEDQSSANKWLILIAYMMGLSIGVHLLNLVTIPALALIYYFKKSETITKRGIFATMAISGAIIFLIMVVIIPGLPSIAGSFEVFFINTIGLPFGSGIVIFAVLFISVVVYGIYYTSKKQKVIWNTAMLCLSFILIGYASYAIALIRSSYDPPIDQNDPENIISFVSYLKREQYGNRPLFKGPYFDADLVRQERGSAVYIKGEDEYEIVDYKVKSVHDPARSTIMPRAYSSDQNHVRRYREIMDLGSNEVPSFSDNLVYMFKHQMGKMYWRYFLWNFVGRESDIQDASWLSPFEAMADAPPSIANNPGRNSYYAIPLILGIIGLLFQYRRDPKTFAVLILLFFLTGLGLILYLNSPPIEPRERDYIYAGSYYAYAIWIGFSVLALFTLLSNFFKEKKMAVAAAALIGLTAPVLMGTQNWDDHDRSDRYFSVDSAKNFLASCASDAILFTGGDNDTFPLWYSQDVEGFRTDMRVVVLSYFNTDWYINQMTRQAYESEPFPFSLEPKDYRQGGPNDYLPYVENPNISGAIDLKQYLQLIKQGHRALVVPTSISSYHAVPSRTLFMDVDKETVLAKGIVPKNKENRIVDRMYFQVRGSGLEKKDLMILDLIANSNWDRPLYFNNTSKQGINIDLDRYLIQEGNAFRLLPIENPNPQNDFVNTDIMYDNIINKFHFRGLDNEDAYFSEDYRNFVLNHRSSFNTLAEALIDEGQIQKAREVALKSLELMPDNAIPYDYSATKSVDILFQVGEKDQALQIAETIGRRADEELEYYLDRNISLGFEIQKNMIILNDLGRTLNRFGEDELAVNFNDAFQEHSIKLGMYNSRR